MHWSRSCTRRDTLFSILHSPRLVSILHSPRDTLFSILVSLDVETNLESGRCVRQRCARQSCSRPRQSRSRSSKSNSHPRQSRSRSRQSSSRTRTYLSRLSVYRHKVVLGYEAETYLEYSPCAGRRYNDGCRDS